MKSDNILDHQKKKQISLKSLISEIDNAFLRLEKYWNSKSDDYSYFGFREQFDKLQKECKDLNSEIQIGEIQIDRYYKVFQKINSYNNENILKVDSERRGYSEFESDIEDICSLHHERIKTFGDIYPYDEFALKKGRVSFIYLLQDRPTKEKYIKFDGFHAYLNSSDIKWHEIFFSALDEPDFSRAESWKIHQEKSGYTPLVFFRCLLLVWNAYNSDILKTECIEEEEADFKYAINVHVPILRANSGSFQKDLDKNTIKDLYKSLQELYDLFELKEQGLIVLNPGKELKVDIVDENKTDHHQEDPLKLSIDDHMAGCNNAFRSDSEFKNACSELFLYFKKGSISISQPIFVKRGWKVKLAYEIGSIYKEFNSKPISFEFLNVLIRLFSVYNNKDINRERVVNTNLYKYLTTKN